MQRPFRQSYLSLFLPRMSRLDPTRRDLLLCYDFPPMGGGIARWMAELARGYPAGTLLVSTGSLPGAAASDAELPNPVDRIGVPAGRLRNPVGLLRWARRVTRLGRDPRTRFLWCGNIRPAAVPAKWAGERTGLGYGVMVHGGDLLALGPKLARSAMKRRLYRPMLREAAVYVANSQWTAARTRDLLDAMGLPEVAERIRVVPLGTDPVRWRADGEATARFRAARGLPPGRYLVTVARLVPHKGIDTALRVLAALVPRHPDLRYLVIGRGAQHDALRALAAELGVADRLHLLGDVTDEELPAAMGLGELYLGLSREAGLDAEGFGIALLEAAAMGLPVVAGASGGIADAVADGETGLLVDPVDPGPAVDAVRHLLGDQRLATRLGAAGRARVERRFTWARVVDDLRAIAEELGRR